MKSLIAYYSYSGNTRKVAEAFKNILAVGGSVTLERLVPMRESGNFIVQCLAARFGTRAILSGSVTFDLSDYDLLCLGTPVWAFAPVPAVNTYLDNLSGAEGKKALIFTTYGSGAGVGNCVAAIKKQLDRKGIAQTEVLNIQQDDVEDTARLEETIRRCAII